VARNAGRKVAIQEYERGVVLAGRQLPVLSPRSTSTTSNQAFNEPGKELTGTGRGMETGVPPLSYADSGAKPEDPEMTYGPNWGKGRRRVKRAASKNPSRSKGFL